MGSRASLILAVIILLIVSSTTFAQDNPASPTDSLVRVLVSKGVITPEEARLIGVNASPAEQRDRLATLLRDKGVISSAEFEMVRTGSPNTKVAPINANYKTSAAERPAPAPQPSPPTAIAPVAPVRLLGIAMPKRDG